MRSGRTAIGGANDHPLTHWRAARQVSAAVVARIGGWSRQTVWLWEAGLHCPSSKSRARIEQITGGEVTAEQMGEAYRRLNQQLKKRREAPENELVESD